MAQGVDSRRAMWRANIALYKARYPERMSANRRAGVARHSGLLMHEKCLVCGSSDSSLCAHHENYALPLDVVFLCRSCHAKLKGTTLVEKFGLEHTDQTEASWQVCSVCANDYARRMLVPDQSEAIAEKDAVWVAVARLPLRDALVIIALFGLDEAPPRTLEAVGADFRITRERVRQIQDTALVAMHNILLEAIAEEAS